MTEFTQNPPIQVGWGDLPIRQTPKFRSKPRVLVGAGEVGWAFVVEHDPHTAHADPSKFIESQNQPSAHRNGPAMPRNGGHPPNPPTAAGDGV
jgi:hypothetical protein